MQPHRVLLVEDDTATRWSLATALQHGGLDVDVAESAAEAKRLIDRFHAEYCCVLLDLVLPDGDGGHIAEHVRATEPGIPIIVVTGAADPDESMRRYADVVRLVIRKPTDVQTLAASIHEHCPRWLPPETQA